jgi:TatD DNase family protein
MRPSSAQREREKVLLPDTHAHLDSEAFDDDRDAVLLRAAEAGVDRILAVGTDLGSSRVAVHLAGRYESVFAAVGVHPHQAERFSEQAEEVRALLEKDKVVGVGEIGLDYYRAGAPRGVQVAVFREQVGWARSRGLPISVHNRAADQDVLAVLRDSPVAAILHCFDSTWEVACQALMLGCYLSFAGNLTYPRAEQLREVAARVPLDRALVETDCPVLAPQPWRGRRNEPSFVAATAEALAQVQDRAMEEVATRISQNAAGLFGWRAA